MRRIFSKDQLMAIVDGQAYVFIPRQVTVIGTRCDLCGWSAHRDRKCGLYHSDVLCRAWVRRDRKHGYWERARP